MFGNDEYPPHMDSSCYVLSLSLIPKMLDVSYDTAMVNHESVYVTGMLAPKAGAQLVDEQLFTSAILLNEACIHRGIISERVEHFEQMQEFFYDITSEHIDCSWANKIPT